MINPRAKYPEVRKWWIDYLDRHPEPIPINTVYFISPDIRKFVKNSIYELDLIVQEYKEGDKKRVKYADTRTQTLIHIATYLND